MQIRFLDEQAEPTEPTEPAAIATDDLGGAFFLGSGGAVYYRNPDDASVWYVNSDEGLFRVCVQAYIRYCRNVQNAADEEVFVREFERELQNVKALAYDPPTYWSLILEQCEDGLL